MGKKDSLANVRLSPEEAKRRKREWQPSPTAVFTDEAVENMGRRMDSYSDDEIAAAAERMRAREAAAASHTKEAEPSLAQKMPIRNKRDVKKKGPGRGRKPAYDRQEIKRLYEDEELTATLIAERLGTTPRTVIDSLKAVGVTYDKNRNKAKNKKPGKGPQDRCSRGHDMNKHSRPVWRMKDGERVQNGRECIPCANERKRNG